MNPLWLLWDAAGPPPAVLPSALDPSGDFWVFDTSELDIASDLSLLD